MFLAAGFSRIVINDNNVGDANRANNFGIAAVSMVFLFTAIFGATWLTVPLLYPAEIFPLDVRAKGNAWGVIGWSIGNGWLGLLCPVLFKAINEKTLYIFAACNILSIPIIWALYPESNQRTLEEMDLLFASDSIWTWDAERDFAILKEQNPELVQAADRDHSGVEPDIGLPFRQRQSRCDASLIVTPDKHSKY